MSTSFADIKKYYNACRPDEPIEPSDPRWVDLSPLRGSGRDIVSQLLRQIDLEAQFTTLLVTGFRGTGKTSLLKACHQKLEQSSYHVIYTDTEADYLMNPHEEINANDILLTLAIAIMDDGLGPFYVERFWNDLKSFAGAQVIPQGVEVKAGGATFKSVLERTPALHERFYSYARKHALYDQVDHLILDAQAEARKKRPRGLVVILDSLDHLSDPSEKSGTPVTDSVLKVLRDTPELRRLGLHLILTLPPTILPYAHDLQTDYGEPFIVPEARIVTKQDKRDEQAFSVMEEFVDKRLPLTCFDSTESARSLIAASGGYLRDLLRLLRNCLVTIDDFPITSEIVKQEIRRRISLSAELPLEDYRTDIKAILDSPEHRLPRNEDNLQRMYQMIRDRVILRYLNSDHWEGIHPFVMAHVDRKRFDQLVFPDG